MIASRGSLMSPPIPYASHVAGMNCIGPRAPEMLRLRTRPNAEAAVRGRVVAAQLGRGRGGTDTDPGRRAAAHAGDQPELAAGEHVVAQLVAERRARAGVHLAVEPWPVGEEPDHALLVECEQR